MLTYSTTKGWKVWQLCREVGDADCQEPSGKLKEKEQMDTD